MIKSEELNKGFIGAIREKLSDGEGHASMANDLMDMLFIGKEAVYRRLRNEVPFSFAEAVFIAKKLGISIDKIAGNLVSQNISFKYTPTRFSNPQDADYYMLKEYLDVLKTARDSDESEFMYASNLFPQFPGFIYSHLVRFHSFRWSYMHDSVEDVKPYHEVCVPDKLIEIRKEIIKETWNIKETCYMWDAGLFLSMVNDIQFFSSISYLRKEDISLIKEELLMLINDMEAIATKGEFETGNKVDVYISNTNFDASYSYLKTSKFKVSMIGVFGLNFLNALDEASFKKMHLWMQSLKKFSILISESGEIHRAQFFKKQREIINIL